MINAVIHFNTIGITLSSKFAPLTRAVIGDRVFMNSELCTQFQADRSVPWVDPRVHGPARDP